MDTVKESKLKLHKILSDSESIHLNICRETGMLLYPTSKKVSTASTVVSITDVQDITCDPLTPIFLPKNPEAIEDNKGNIIIIRYII